jgi:hypothetical protein
LVVDLDVELNVAGVHTGDSNVDAVGLTGIRQFVLKPNAQDEPVRSRTQCVPNTKRPENPTTKLLAEGLTALTEALRELDAKLEKC